MKRLLALFTPLLVFLALATSANAADPVVSTGKPATASSVESPISSSCAKMPGGSCSPGLAVDGLTTTRWSSAASDPQWIQVDLGQTYNISRVNLNWETAYGSGYKIQTSSDATNWTDIFSTTTGDGGIDDLTLTGSGRYVRMFGTARGTFPAHNWGYSLWEFQVYGVVPPSADTTPPDTTITTAPSGATSSNSASIGFTGTDNVGVAGFECSLDGGAYVACTSPQAYANLPDGGHTVSVRAKDAAGNTDPTPATASWTVDTTAPNTTITAQPSNPTTSTSASFSFTSTEAGTFQCSLDGAAYASCTSPKTYTALPNGSHTFSVKAADAVGNTDTTPASYTWTVNAPVSDPLRISTNANRSGNVDLEGYVVASPTTQVCVYLSNDPPKTGSVVFYLDGVNKHTEGIVPWDYFGTANDNVNCLTGTFTAGTHTIRATWTGGEDSSTFSVAAAAADTTAPTAPTNLAANAGDAQASLSWTASTDNVGVAGYRVYRNGAQVGTPTGTTFTDTGLTNGTAYSYTVKAIDAAGNLSAASNAVSVTPQASSQPPATYSHVIWVIMENHGYNQIIGNSGAPYINSLVGSFGSATNMFAESHPSLPNYLAMTSGSTQGVTDDANPASHRLNVENIFHQLGGGQSRSLMESMPSNCYGSDFIDSSGGKYSAHHNPMAYYSNLGTDCANYDVPLSSTPDLTGKFTFVVPNQCNNMHDCSVTTGDNFLKGFIPKIQATADYQAGKTAVFITWDEDEGTEGNHIPTLIVHPNGAHNTTACQGTRYTHYSMLRFVEDNFGLARVGNAATANSMSACFGLSGGSTADTTAPSAPTLSGSAGDTTATLNWSGATDNVGVTGYRVFRDGALVGSPTGTSFTDTGLTNGTAYVYTVKAIDAAGNLSVASNSVTLTPAASGGGTGGPLGPPGNWTSTFDDEFNGTSLDRTHWSPCWFYPTCGSQNNVATDPANVTVSGGNAILTRSSSTTGASMETNPNGGAGSGFQFQYGVVEARIWFPGDGAHCYNWPAWWTDGQSWPTNGENDIAEVLGGDMTVNYHSGSGSHNQGAVPGYWCGGFHTYTLNRKNGSADVYYDGALVKSYATDDAGALQYLIINVGGPGSYPIYGAASQIKVDYVRAWAPA